MASITIRNLDESLESKLRVQAAQHGRSMEDEARVILKTALSGADQKEDLATAIRRRIAPFGGVELRIPPREAVRRPPRFEK